MNALPALLIPQANYPETVRLYFQLQNISFSRVDVAFMDSHQRHGLLLTSKRGFRTRSNKMKIRTSVSLIPDFANETASLSLIEG